MLKFGGTKEKPILWYLTFHVNGMIADDRNISEVLDKCLELWQHLKDGRQVHAATDSAVLCSGRHSAVLFTHSTVPHRDRFGRQTDRKHADGQTGAVL